MLVWVARPHRCNRAHGTGENFFRMRNSPKFAQVLLITLQGLVGSTHTAGGQARGTSTVNTCVNSGALHQLGPTATLTNDALQRVGRGPSSLSHERNSRTRPPHLIACPAFACTPPLYAPSHLPLPLSDSPHSPPGPRQHRRCCCCGRPLWKASSRWRAVEGLEPLAGTPID